MKRRIYHTLNSFITSANIVHDKKYDYSHINQYDGAKTKINIVCFKHGTFSQTPQKHLLGQGCPLCGKEEMGKKNSLTTNEFIEKAKKIHGDKYDYSAIQYKNNHTLVKILCKNHGFFKQIPNSHLSGKGCARCGIIESTGSKMIDKILSIKNVFFIKEYTFNGCVNKRKLRFDFYLPDHNICIEFDGRQHFEPIEVFGGQKGFEEMQKNDYIKTIFCIKNSIKLIRVSYLDDIEETLKGIKRLKQS
ncbi:MAG: hypothetical protein HC836_15625 [Richelia sp. RM2_1_2]|nr:hypothetical protein [Richelia sp. RM2_1_2]